MKRRIAEKHEPDSTESRDAIERTGVVVSIEEIESRIAHGYYSEAEKLLLDVVARTATIARNSSSSRSIISTSASRISSESSTRFTCYIALPSATRTGNASCAWARFSRRSAPCSAVRRQLIARPDPAHVWFYGGRTVASINFSKPSSKIRNFCVMRAPEACMA